MRIVKAILFMLVFTCIHSSLAFAEEIRIIGGAAAIGTVFSPIKEAYEKATADRLTIRLSDPTESLIALEKGEVDMASINSLSVDSAIEKARKKGVEIDPATLHRVQIASSMLVVFLERANQVTRLTKEQLKGIFTGKITNWREVGGEDREIIVIWGKETPYLNNLFSKKILDGEPVTPKARQSGDHFELRKLVMATPGSIAINTSGLIMPKLKVPEIPQMPLPILAMTKGEPSAKVKKVLDYYKNEFGFMDE